MAKKTYSKKSHLENIGHLGANESRSPDDRGNGLPLEARAFLDTLAGPESGGDYNVIYRGDQFNSYDAHPKVWVKIPNGPQKGKYSSAAGKYQFIKPTWDKASGLAGVEDFSPASQDRAAWALAQETYRTSTGRDLLADLKSGDQEIMSGIPRALSSEWDSLPGGGQPGTTASQFVQTFNQRLATTSGHVVPPLGMASDPPVPRPREAGASAREGYTAPAAPVPEPRWKGSVARVLDATRTPSLADLPMPPAGIAGGQPFRSEDHPKSNVAPGIIQAVRPEGPAAGMPRATSGEISIGNPMAEPAQPVTLKPVERPAIVRYDPNNGVRETVLPGRPDSLPLAKNASGSPDDRSSAPTASPKYITTKVPLTMKEVNPAYEAWAKQYAGKMNQSGSPDDRDERKALAAPPPPPQFIETQKTKTVVKLNPDFGKPVVMEVQAPGLTGARPALIKTKSPGLGAKAYDQANQAARDRAIAGAADPTKAASRASLAAQWGFE